MNVPCQKYIYSGWEEGCLRGPAICHSSNESRIIHGAVFNPLVRKIGHCQAMGRNIKGDMEVEY